MPRRISKAPWHRYAEDVLTGKIVAGLWVRLACERHLRDLSDGWRRGLIFSEDAAAHFCDFVENFCIHHKGEWAKKPFLLEPWQKFTQGNIFGWKWKASGFRRTRVFYEEVARKNGKSQKGAATGIYLLLPDGEPGAEISSAATTTKQSKIIWGEAKRIVRSSPSLSRKIGIVGGELPGQLANLHVLDTAAKFEPLSGEAETADGLNGHGIIVDELHAHKTRAMWDVLDTCTGSRRQPLIYAVTTAGTDRHSVCWEQHDYATKVLQGIIDDDTFFAFIASLDPPGTYGDDDPGDDWEDERSWPKANPNLGVSVKLEDLRSKAKKAAQSPSAQNAFRRLHCNEWTESAIVWIPDKKWVASAGLVDVPSLRGRRCFGGLDLAVVKDLTAFVLAFPPEGKDDLDWKVLCFFWVPEENISDRSKRDRVPYDVWREQGWITATPGDITDFRWVGDDIVKTRELYDIQEVGYDRHLATELVTRLGENGLEMAPLAQGPQTMNAPIKDVERLTLARLLHHGGNPVLRWNMSNVVLRQDSNANLALDKDKARERIDGAAALVMAVQRATITGSGGSGSSDYQAGGKREGGLLVL